MSSATSRSSSTTSTRPRVRVGDAVLIAGECRSGGLRDDDVAVNLARRRWRLESAGQDGGDRSHERAEVDAPGDLEDGHGGDEHPIAIQLGRRRRSAGAAIEVEGAEILSEDLQALERGGRIETRHAQALAVSAPAQEHERAHPRPERYGARAVDGVQVHVALALERPQ